MIEYFSHYPTLGKSSFGFYKALGFYGSPDGNEVIRFLDYLNGWRNKEVETELQWAIMND